MGDALVHAAMTNDQIDLIKRTVANKCTNDELALFLHTAQRMGLDPLAKQIYAVKRGSTMAIQIGIDGARLTAQRSGELDGQDGPYWCTDDGVWRDVWLGTAPLIAAKVTVFRKGSSHGFTGVARFDSYSQDTNLWNSMPDVMIAKCAEALALRKGFPAELSGVYTHEEMMQADTAPAVADATPAPTRTETTKAKLAAMAGANGSATVPADDYRFPRGPLVGRMASDCTTDTLQGLMDDGKVSPETAEIFKSIIDRRITGAA